MQGLSFRITGDGIRSKVRLTGYTFAGLSSASSSEDKARDSSLTKWVFKPFGGLPSDDIYAELIYCVKLIDIVLKDLLHGNSSL